MLFIAWMVKKITINTLKSKMSLISILKENDNKLEEVFIGLRKYSIEKNRPIN
jgi:hypothetical protein